MKQDMATLRIDTDIFEIGDVLGLLTLEKGIDGADVVRRLVAMERIADRRGVTPTSADTGAVLDEWRQEVGFERAADMKSWMREAGVSKRALELFGELMVLEQAIIDSITDEEIAEQQERSADSGDFRHVYAIFLDAEVDSESLAEALRNAPESFMHTAVLRSVDPDSRMQGGYIGCVAKDELPSDVAESLFAINDGDIVGPVHTDDGAMICTAYGVREDESAQTDDIAIIEELIEYWVEMEARTRVVQRPYLQTSK